nr:MAG TPA: hypothetical protein [Caudoviricetes sp.]
MVEPFLFFCILYTRNYMNNMYFLVHKHCFIHV